MPCTHARDADQQGCMLTSWALLLQKLSCQRMRVPTAATQSCLAVQPRSQQGNVGQVEQHAEREPDARQLRDLLSDMQGLGARHSWHCGSMTQTRSTASHARADE